MWYWWWNAETNSGMRHSRLTKGCIIQPVPQAVSQTFCFLEYTKPLIFNDLLQHILGRELTSRLTKGCITQYQW